MPSVAGVREHVVAVDHRLHGRSHVDHDVCPGPVDLVVEVGDAGQVVRNHVGIVDADRRDDHVLVYLTAETSAGSSAPPIAARLLDASSWASAANCDDLEPPRLVDLPVEQNVGQLHSAPHADLA